jgi:hypothetical protein
MNVDGNLLVRRAAALGGNVVERSLAVTLDRAERLAALGISVVLKGARSEIALRSAQTAIGFMHSASPVAARVAGRITSMSLLGGGQAVRAGLLVFAATVRRIRP